MPDDSTRRQFLLTTGSATVLALAGCAGDDETDTPTGTESMDNGTMDSETTEGGMNSETTESGMNDDDGMDDGMDGGPTTFTVRVENVAPTDFYAADSSTGGAVWITPGAYAVHTDANPIFTEGEAASIGLEALAEAGPPTGFEGETGLVEELQSEMSVVSAGAYTPENTVADPNDPMGEVPGAPPIAPGGAFEFDIEAESGQHLSLASMFVPSNDIFIAPGETGIPLWEDDSPREGDVTVEMALWDAGTEPNGQPGQDPDQAPAQDSPDQGGDEGGVVRPLADVGDGYDYPAVEDVIQVTLTPQ